MTRVQIPAYHDAWMRGDRYGEIVKIVMRWKPDPLDDVELAYVKLDKSGKTVRVILADCEVIEMTTKSVQAENKLSALYVWGFMVLFALIACAHYLQKIYRLLEARR